MLPKPRAVAPSRTCLRQFAFRRARRSSWQRRRATERGNGACPMPARGLARERKRQALFRLHRSSSITIVRAAHPRSGAIVHPAGRSAAFPDPRPAEQAARVAFAQVRKASTAKRGPRHSAESVEPIFSAIGSFDIGRSGRKESGSDGSSSMRDCHAATSGLKPG